MHETPPMSRVAAVQLEFTYYSTPQEVVDLVRAPVEQARAAGAELIVLPDRTSFMLFGMFDTDQEAHHVLASLAGHGNSLAGRSTAPAARAWLAERAGYVHEFYLHLFQSLANRVEAWLVPGSVLETDGETFHLTTFLINPAGELVGRQPRLAPTPAETAWGVKPGDSGRVFATEVGTLGLLSGDDSTHPEIAAALTQNGANALIHCGAQLAPDAPVNFRQTTSGQSVYGIEAQLVGRGFYGRSAIYAPDRILAQAPEAQPVILVADLEFPVPA